MYLPLMEIRQPDFAQDFGAAGNPPAAGCQPGVDADLDDDGDVDLGDFTRFAANCTGPQ